jgi:hypothetical protein
MRKQITIEALIQQVFSTSGWLTFLLGSIGLGVAVNGASGILYALSAHATASPAKQSALTLAAGFIVVLSAAYLIKRQLRTALQVPTLTESSPAPTRGLILLVSRNDAAPEVAAAATQPHHAAGTLQHVWLICTPQSSADASRTRDHLKALLRLDIMLPSMVNDVVSPTATHERVIAILSDLPKGWTPRDVTIDYTGLTASASLGAAMAAWSAGAALQYTPANYRKDGGPVAPRQPVLVRLPPRG